MICLKIVVKYVLSNSLIHQLCGNFNVNKISIIYENVHVSFIKFEIDHFLKPFQTCFSFHASIFLL